MKKRLFIFFGLITALLIIVSFFIILNRKEDKEITYNIPGMSHDVSVSPTMFQVPTKSNSGNIKSVWLRVNDIGKLFLYSNLDEKTDSKSLSTKKSCAHLINGGFYDKENRHIGLFISEGATLQDSINSSLLNGYFSVSKTGTASITEYPVFSPRIS